MVACSWCRQMYSEPVLYHVCPDGTTFNQRLEKIWQQREEEYSRQDRLRAESKSSNLSVREKDIISWSHYDLAILRGMKIDP